MAARDPRIERHGERANAAAEADAAIPDPAGNGGIELRQHRHRDPQVLDTAADDVAIGVIDIVQHMPGGVFRDRRTTTARKPAKT